MGNKFKCYPLRKLELFFSKKTFLSLFISPFERKIVGQTNFFSVSLDKLCKFESTDKTENFLIN